MRVIGTVAVVIFAVPSLVLSGSGENTIFNTKHNLSVTGKGPIKSLTETRVCVFCHSSHNASKEGPLWGHETTETRSFKTYDRSTLTSKPEQPNGATKLCLSCHDGTIAVGAIRGLSQSVPMSNVDGGGEIPGGRKSNLGTDLTGTHPVSIQFSQATAVNDKHLRWPPYDPADKVGVDSDGYVQCTSCHDPHSSKSDKYPFWKKETFEDVCTVCHEY